VAKYFGINRITKAMGLAAKTLGFEVPARLLFTADEVIE